MPWETIDEVNNNNMLEIDVSRVLQGDVPILWVAKYNIIFWTLVNVVGSVEVFKKLYL